MLIMLNLKDKLSWSDKNEFKCETLRTVILGLLALWYIRPGEAEINYKLEVDKALLANKAKLISDIQTTSDRYIAVAHDACRGNEKDIELFKGDAFDNYSSTLDLIKVYFHDSAAIKNKVEHITKETNPALYEIFTNCDPTNEDWQHINDKLRSESAELAIALAGEIKAEEQSRSNWLQKPGFWLPAIIAIIFVAIVLLI